MKQDEMLENTKGVCKRGRTHRHLRKSNFKYWCFQIWCWRRLLRVPWSARKSNQYILKEIHPEYSLEGLMLKLKLQYFDHLMWRTDSSEKTLMLDKTKGRNKNEGRRRRGWQRMRWLDGITDSIDGHEFEQAPGVGDGQGSLACCHPWDYKESDTTEWLNWRLNILKSILNTLIK